MLNEKNNGEAQPNTGGWGAGAQPMQNLQQPVAPPLPMGYQGAPGGIWQPPTEITVIAAQPQQVKEPAMPTTKFLAMLVLGLLPVLGFVFALHWAFSLEGNETKHSFAKALLWLHGIALAAVLAGLCVWVLGLARNVVPLL